MFNKSHIILLPIQHFSLIERHFFLQEYGVQCNDSSYLISVIVYPGPLNSLFVFEIKAKIVIMTDAHTMSEYDGIADHAARTP